MNRTASILLRALATGLVAAFALSACAAPANGPQATEEQSLPVVTVYSSPT